MKHLSAYALSMAAIFLLLSSCASLSFDKRRYSSGYTVHSSHYKSGPQLEKKENVKNENTKLASNDKSEQETETYENIKTTNNDVAVLSDGIEEFNSVPVKANNSLISNEKSSSVKVEQVQTRHSKKTSILKSGVKKQAQNIASASSSSDEGLSLLGLVVLVVLIIYLLAYFSGGWGLGGAVHLILLVALILLILWLLGVI